MPGTSIVSVEKCSGLREVFQESETRLTIKTNLFLSRAKVAITKMEESTEKIGNFNKKRG
jgi:hypothetical protein